MTAHTPRAASTSVTEPDDATDARVVQRLVLPAADGPPELRAVYLDDTGPGPRASIRDRRALVLPAGGHVSTCAYFNAVPASYWYHHTTVSAMTLRLRAQGSGRVDVYRSTARGATVHLATRTLDSDAERLVTFDPVSLKRGFADGGWLWFDVTALGRGLTVHRAAWLADKPLPRPRVAVGITTMRPHDAVAAAAALADADLGNQLASVLIVDQGATKVRTVPGYTHAVERLGSTLTVIEQDNIGGSGGFARVMHHALTTTDADLVMLLDDDVALEPDSVARAVRFASALRRPSVVGSHMLDLHRRTRLLAVAEIVDLDTCLWRPAPGSVTGHDFATHTLRDTPALHARLEANYNGWWMCTIPRRIIEDIGLPLPLFIKWDDAEHCLRAAARGYPTVSLPGSALWHIAWTEKNDTVDWQAYFHLRNRLVTAALHSPPDIGNRLLPTGIKDTMRHLLSMEYSTVALHHKAITDFLAGPEALFASLRTALPEVRQLRAHFPDAQTRPGANAFPLPTNPTNAHHDNAPHSRARRLATAARVLRHQLTPVRTPNDRPQTNLPAHHRRWDILGHLDHATVTSGDGTTTALRHRDPAQFRTMLTTSLRDHNRLRAAWPEMTARYQAALPELTSMQRWAHALDNTPAS